MQPGAQNEVAIEQRTSLAEKREEIFAYEAVDLSMEGGGPRRLCPGSQELALPLSVLPGSVVGGLLAIPGSGDNFNFHICAFG